MPTVKITPMESKPGMSQLELVSMDSEEDVLNDNRLPKAEAELLLVVKAGEVDDLFEHLRLNPALNVNIMDYRGLTPLSMTVRAEQLDLVDALLAQREVKLGDAMLHAVNTGNVGVLERLLDWRQRAVDNQIPVDDLYDSSYFESYMTPLMLACHNNDYEMVRILLRHGHSLPTQDMSEYSVGDKKVGETLELGRARMEAYRAHASAVYMTLTAPDPLYQAFLYAHAADKLGYLDPIFKEDYVALSESCKEFAVKVLEECRTSEEVRVLLAQPHDYKETGVPSSGKYPRLQLALAFEFKEFIVHKNCQQVLQNIWTQEHPNIMWMPMVWRILYFIPHILLLPFVYLLYIVFPCAPFLKYWAAPMNKFLGDVVSFFTFLALLFYTIVNTEISRGELGKRVPSLNSGVDIVIWIFVLSYLWDHVKLWYFHGVKAYIKDWWNIYTLSMTFIFLTSFIARLASFIIVLQKRGSDRGYEMTPRKEWPWNDPMLVSEAFYSLGAILAFGRILYLFTISQILGPLQLSLSNMISDVLQMMTIMMITMFAFAMGISRLYIFYAGGKRTIGSETTEQPNYFNDFTMTFRTLFWDLFGFGSRDDPLLYVDNQCTSSSSVPCPSPGPEHVLTENMGFVLYGLFHLVMLTTMLNMLIGMMGNTLGRIQENSDREWKFARSKLWVAFFDRSSLLPNPFNMIPTPYDIYMLIRWAISCRSDDEEAGWDRNMCCYKIDSDELRQQKEDADSYKVLLLALMKRFLSQTDIDEEKETVTAELLEQAKADIIKELYRATSGTSLPAHNRHSRYGRSPSPVIEDYAPTKRQENGSAVPSAYI